MVSVRNDGQGQSAEKIPNAAKESIDQTPQNVGILALKPAAAGSAMITTPSSPTTKQPLSPKFEIQRRNFASIVEKSKSASTRRRTETGEILHVQLQSKSGKWLQWPVYKNELDLVGEMPKHPLILRVLPRDSAVNRPSNSASSNALPSGISPLGTTSIMPDNRRALIMSNQENAFPRAMDLTLADSNTVLIGGIEVVELEGDFRSVALEERKGKHRWISDHDGYPQVGTGRLSSACDTFRVHRVKDLIDEAHDAYEVLARG